MAQPPTPEQRRKLERLAEMAREGRAAEAELELHGWCRQDGPSAARTFLAALLARRGDHAAARQVLDDLPRRDPHAMDPEEAKLAVSVLIASGLDDQARRLGAWLLKLHGGDADVRRWLEVMDLPGLPRRQVAQPAMTARSRRQAEHLALELSVNPELVTSLVYAMKQEPATRPISLLRGAVHHLVRSFEDRPELARLCQAAAELALLVGDEDDARRWAHRTLRLDPFNASMALLLGKVADDEAVGPPAREMLKRVSLRFPTYPDVRKAYEQRSRRDRDERAAA